MGTIFVDNIKEHSASNGVHIPGHIIQVVEGTTSTTNSTTSTSVVDSGLTATITPKYNTSKILAIASVPYHASEEPGTDVQAYLFFKRTVSGGSTVELASCIFGDHTGNANRSDQWGTVSMTKLDNPATTSATTYKVQHRVGNSGYTGYAMNNSNPGMITLMEISV
tara:strand:- start:21 stop:518 length:498 start_codon:yes stop_codon:yes gene_type:complete